MSNVTSQSELTTKEIVEQAIQDYHESILPYLNGGDAYYSLEEQKCGTWVDGKVLWKNTVLTGTAVPSGATEISRITNGQTGYDTIQYTKA